MAEETRPPARKLAYSKKAGPDEELMKKLIRGKFQGKEPFSDAEKKWMERKDWHPVDELGLKPEFLVSLKEAEKETKRRKPRE
ncbi:Uncharacterised protein [uncultured archaeon]|nr:Uncharacterised protein [uncultured archaeon]